MWGRSVNMSCSSSANPPAQNYTWFRRTDASGPSGLQVGSGQVLYISSMEASLSGLYLCQARNQLGEKNSSEVLLAMVEEEQQGLCLLHFGWIIWVKGDEVTRVCDLLRQPGSPRLGWTWTHPHGGFRVRPLSVLVGQP